MEGPSLVILREELAPFLKQKVLAAEGSTAQPKESLVGCTLRAADTWGKVLFLTFSPGRRRARPIVTKTHFLMFGSYRIDKPKPQRVPKLALTFPKGALFFYSCAIRFGAEAEQAAVDRKVDLMSEEWDVKHVTRLMGDRQDEALCDLMMDQRVFAGAGNIVKNEVLFLLRRHPLETLASIPKAEWPRIAREVRDYCWKFYEWKKEFTLRKHWQVFKRRSCPVCKGSLTLEKLGKLHRRTFYCPTDQPRIERPSTVATGRRIRALT
jgi:endonuclease-8